MTEQRTIEAHGSDVEEAIESGLRRLGLSRKDVVIEIIEEGRKGLLGLGSREARVRLTTLQATDVTPAAALESPPVPPAEAPEEAESVATPETMPEMEAEAAVRDEPEVARDAAEQIAEEAEELAPEPAVVEPQAEEETEPEPEEAPAEREEADETEPEAEEIDSELAETVREIVGDLVHHMGFEEATVSVSHSEPDDRTGRIMTTVEVEGDNLGALIGPHGETLDDLQYMARLMAGHALRRRANFMIDVDGYRRKRKMALAKLAERMAQKAIRREEPVTLEPMSAYDRRLVHVALRDHEKVYTNSVGEGSNRRVRIYLKD